MNSISFAVRSRQVRDPEFWIWQLKHNFTLKNSLIHWAYQAACKMFEFLASHIKNSRYSTVMMSIPFLLWLISKTYLSIEYTRSQMTYLTLNVWVYSQWNANWRDLNEYETTLTWNSGPLGALAVWLYSDKIWQVEKRRDQEITEQHLFLFKGREGV